MPPVMLAQKSSNIKAIGYDEDALELYVQFYTSGLTYIYSDVKPEQYEALLKADSIGSYFAKHIRPKHPARKLDDDKTKEGPGLDKIDGDERDAPNTDDTDSADPAGEALVSGRASGHSRQPDETF